MNTDFIVLVSFHCSCGFSWFLFFWTIIWKNVHLVCFMYRRGQWNRSSFLSICLCIYVYLCVWVRVYNMTKYAKLRIAFFHPFLFSFILSLSLSLFSWFFRLFFCHSFFPFVNFRSFPFFSWSFSHYFFYHFAVPSFLLLTFSHSLFLCCLSFNQSLSILQSLPFFPFSLFLPCSRSLSSFSFSFYFAVIPFLPFQLFLSCSHSLFSLSSLFLLCFYHLSVILFLPCSNHSLFLVSYFPSAQSYPSVIPNILFLSFFRRPK